MKKVLSIINFKQKIVKLFVLLFIFAVSIGLSVLLWKHVENFRKPNDEQKKKITKNYINQIHIPSLSLSLDVTLAPRKNGEWQMTNAKTAFFGEASAHPGTSGTTVVFAHAQDGLFANLPMLNNDDKIALVTDNTVYVYNILFHQVVSADETSFITRRGKNHLVLFTCFGIDDKKRIVFIGNLIKRMSLPNLHTPIHTL